jgi:hypothetical protein
VRAAAAETGTPAGDGRNPCPPRQGVVNNVFSSQQQQQWRLSYEWPAEREEPDQ